MEQLENVPFKWEDTKKTTMNSQKKNQHTDVSSS